MQIKEIKELFGTKWLSINETTYLNKEDILKMKSRLDEYVRISLNRLPFNKYIKSN